MKAEPEEFEDLRRILALKRYEQPPPGYFDQLSGRIIDRIHAENYKASFWERFFSGMVLKPATAYAFGLAVCGILVAGVGYSLKTEDEAGFADRMPETFGLDAPLVPILSSMDNPSGVRSGTDSLMLSSTNPVVYADPLFIERIHEQPSIFEALQLHVEPAGFNR